MLAGQLTSHRRLPNRLGLPEIGLCLTLVLLAVHAAVYWFLTDDAYISFRYARNLSNGYGLVFNPGFERVEGYTNFLWVLLLAGLNTLGLAPEQTANVISAAATAGLWALVVWWVFRSPPAPPRRWLLLIAPLCLAATRSVAVWSSSGLETRLFEVLVVGAALRLVVELESHIAGQRPRPVAAVLFALATLTRPDGLLISLAALMTAGACLAFRRRLQLRSLAMQIGLYVLIVGAHLGFRLAYYGQWLPNTYYAKVDGRTWWDMGLTYLAVFALEYGMYLWVPLLVAALYEHRRRETLYTPAIFAAIIIPHALYVASIGGDHFEYRPLDLYFPFAFILLYDGARCLARRATASVLTAAYLGLVILGLVWLPYQSHIQFPGFYAAGFPGKPRVATNFMRADRDPLFHLPGLRRIAQAHRAMLWKTTKVFVGVRQEEHRMFLESVLPQAHRLRKLVDSGVLPADIHLAMSCAGAIPYYTDLRVLDMLGLTDAHVAHSPFRTGPRMMAHNKEAAASYLREAGVDFSAYDGVNSVVHVTSEAWRKCLAETMKRGIKYPLYVAEVGDGYYLFGYLPQGIEQARRRAPRLRFQRFFQRTAATRIIQEAVAAYVRILRENPGDLRTRIMLADLLYTTDQWAAAIGQLEAVVSVLPEEPEIWQRLASLYTQAGRYDKALAAAQRALALLRNVPDPEFAGEIRGQVSRIRARAASRAEPSVPVPVPVGPGRGTLRGGRGF